MSSACSRELEPRGLIAGVEHDAAQLAGGLVVTQDALVEGVHFRLDWLAWRDLGWRAAAVNLSDLAASGAEPEALVVTLALAGRHEVDGCSSSTAGSPRRACPSRRRHDARRRRSCSASPRSAAPSACPGGRARGRAICSS